jgi:CDP-glucose 4,6-dehydratase
MGGHDPYSSSKGMAELAISAYRRSFFGLHPVKIASARAGNVIGGGDWAQDRIVPDCIRALSAGLPIPVRNKSATRPWQHVLEPLSGYLALGEALSRSGDPRSPDYASPFNFGPGLGSNRPVGDLVGEILKHWPGEWRDQGDPGSPHEAGLLSLATDKAHHLLGWSPVWDFPTTIARTVDWYREALRALPAGGNIADLTLSQIDAYSDDARRQGIPWSRR